MPWTTSYAGGLGKVCLYPYCSVNPNSLQAEVGDFRAREVGPLKDSNNIFNNRYLSSGQTIPAHLRPRTPHGPSQHVDGALSDS